MTITSFQTERQLLEALIARIHLIDPDVLLAHNLCGSVLEILLARVNFYNVPHWSRIGRLKKN
jgi:DNA polymerase alpha subunit A